MAGPSPGDTPAPRPPRPDDEGRGAAGRGADGRPATVSDAEVQVALHTFGTELLLLVTPRGELAHASGWDQAAERLAIADAEAAKGPSYADLLTQGLGRL